MKRGVVGVLVLSMFVSACSGGTTDTAAPEVPATTETTATTAVPTTTQPPATTATPTTVAPTTTAAPTTTTLEIPGDPGNYLDCENFPSAAHAQDWFDWYYPYYGDVAGLDRNGDGIACDPGDDRDHTAGIKNGVVAGCGWFDSQQQAQEWLEANHDFGEGVDFNDDGIACSVLDNCCSWGTPMWPPGKSFSCPVSGEGSAPTTATQYTLRWWAAADFCNGALPTAYPLPTGQPVDLEMLTAPEESDEELCRIPQLPGSRTGGYHSTAFPVAFDNLLPDQNVRLATIPIDWDDHEGNPANLPVKHKQVQILIDFYETASQGSLTFTPTFANRWYRLPESVSDYPQQQISDFNPKLAQHGIDAADSDIDFSQIDMVVFIFPVASPIIAGVPPSPMEQASIQHFSAYSPGDERMVFSDEGWVRNYIGGGMYFEHPLRPVWSYYIHEAAHMWDIPDWYIHEANAIFGSQQVPEVDFDWDGGPLNVWGVMSAQDGPSRTFVAWTRWLFGWLDDDQVDCYTIEQVQQHGSFDTELVALDIYEPGTKAIIIRTGDYSGLLIESRRPVFPDDYIAIWETVGRDPYGLIVYEIDATKGDGDGTLSLVTPDGHDFKDLLRSGGTDRYHLKTIDALFNVGNTATVQGIEIELLFTGDRDIVRISK